MVYWLNSHTIIAVCIPTLTLLFPALFWDKVRGGEGSEGREVVSLLSDFPKDLIYIPCGISQDRIVSLPLLNALHNKG